MVYKYILVCYVLLCMTLCNFVGCVLLRMTPCSFVGNNILCITLSIIS
jgi:hypothetical protein